MRNYFVYILRCADRSLYIGVTNDLERRLWEHQAGINEGVYTHDRRPVTLAHFIVFAHIQDAIDCEKMIKAWSKQKKEALIKGDRQMLKLLTKKKFPIRWKRRIKANVEAWQQLMWEEMVACLE